MSKGDTRERIMDASLGLFNERGTAVVSTNHVAREAGISSGNLYYHYRNKEEIIRALWERADVAWDVAYAMPAGREPNLEDMRDMLEDTFAMVWRYRFFYRELGALTRRDPELHRDYIKVYRRGLDGTEELLRSFVESGVLVEVGGPGGRRRIAKLLMLVAEFWLPAAEISGETVSRDRLREGVDLMMEVLRPHLVDEELAGLGHQGSKEGGR